MQIENLHYIRPQTPTLSEYLPPYPLDPQLYLDTKSIPPPYSSEVRSKLLFDVWLSPHNHHKFTFVSLASRIKALHVETERIGEGGSNSIDLVRTATGQVACLARYVILDGVWNLVRNDDFGNESVLGKFDLKNCILKIDNVVYVIHKNKKNGGFEVVHLPTGNVVVSLKKNNPVFSVYQYELKICESTLSGSVDIIALISVLMLKGFSS